MIRYRKATMADIPELARIRKIQLQDEGQSPDTDMDRGITKLVLHASQMGRKAYARIAFAETDVVMEKDIR